jgi:hypothetical protein
MAPQADEGALADVIGCEMRLLDPRVRAPAGEVAALLDDDFREFGASGRVWDKASVVDAVTAVPGAAASVSDRAAVRLAPGVVLLTYSVTQAGRRSLRSSVWRRAAAGGGWRVLFHQGTLQP